MGRWGNMDKKSIIYVLDNGLASLKNRVKECKDKSELDYLWEEFKDLEKTLYNEGRSLLSMTNKVRFESRINTIRKMLNKIESN